EDFADDRRALAMRAVARQPHLPHREEHAPMRRLEAVADIGERSPDDYAHRVIHVRALHLVFDIDVESDIRHVGWYHVSRFEVLVVWVQVRCSWFEGAGSGSGRVPEPANRNSNQHLEP